MSEPSLAPSPINAKEACDRQMLAHLVQAYCHAVDRRDYALLRSLYHDDAIDDHGAMFRGSPDEYVAWLPSMLANWRATSHRLTNMLFLIDGDTAEGELCAAAWHRTADGSRDIVAHGRYLDRYLKRDGVWKFFRRSLVLDWSEERAVEPTNDEGVETGRSGADDPVYQRLPLFSRQRVSREARS